MISTDINGSLLVDPKATRAGYLDFTPGRQTLAGGEASGHPLRDYSITNHIVDYQSSKSNPTPSDRERGGLTSAAEGRRWPPAGASRPSCSAAACKNWYSHQSERSSPPAQEVGVVTSTLDHGVDTSSGPLRLGPHPSPPPPCPRC